MLQVLISAPKVVSRLQLKALFLSRTPLRILRTGSGIDPGTAFGRPLAGAVKCVCRSRPRKATRPSYITIASHLSPAYLLEWSAPPSLSRSRSRLPCISRLVLSCCCSRLVVCLVPIAIPVRPIQRHPKPPTTSSSSPPSATLPTATESIQSSTADTR